MKFKELEKLLKKSRFRFSERVILCYQCILRAFIKKKTDDTP